MFMSYFLPSKAKLGCKTSFKKKKKFTMYAMYPNKFILGFMIYLLKYNCWQIIWRMRWWRKCGNLKDYCIAMQQFSETILTGI